MAFGRKRPPEPPIEPIDREELLARLGGALHPKAAPADSTEELSRKRSAMPPAGQAWRRALEPREGQP